MKTGGIGKQGNQRKTVGNIGKQGITEENIGIRIKRNRRKQGE